MEIIHWPCLLVQKTTIMQSHLPSMSYVHRNRISRMVVLCFYFDGHMLLPAGMLQGVVCFGSSSSHRPHTLSSTGIVSSKSMQTVGSVGVVEAPEEVIPKQFASVPFQYRRMKAEWKSNVYLARSRIQVGTSALC